MMYEHVGKSNRIIGFMDDCSFKFLNLTSIL